MGLQNASNENVKHFVTLPAPEPPFQTPRLQVHPSPTYQTKRALPTQQLVQHQHAKLETLKKCTNYFETLHSKRGL